MNMRFALPLAAVLGLALALPVRAEVAAPAAGAASPAAAKKETKPAHAKADAAPAARAKRWNTTPATEEQLRAPPGMGDAYAKKIVDNRPYRAKDELVKKKVLPQATYNKVRERIIAKQDA